jgi:ribosomal protein S18 acetylase RimI-like enzyme
MPACGLIVRPAAAGDEAGVLRIARELVDDGTTYTFAPDTTDEELRAYWLPPAAAAKAPRAVKTAGRTLVGRAGGAFVAVLEGEVAGCYVLRPNHAGRGAHVANASYAVSARHWGRGLGRALAEHSIVTAREAGFRAMQFNLVVSTNRRAVALWQSLGFEIVGTLPQVFDHPERGLVDAYVMHRFL